MQFDDTTPPSVGTRKCTSKGAVSESVPLMLQVSGALQMPHALNLTKNGVRANFSK